MSIRDQFKAAAAAYAKVEKVTVPELGDVWVRAMSGAAFDEYEQACALTEKKAGDLRARNANRHLIIRYSVVDENGNSPFSPADDDFLKSLPVAVANPIVQKATELAGLGGADAGND